MLHALKISSGTLTRYHAKLAQRVSESESWMWTVALTVRHLCCSNDDSERQRALEGVEIIRSAVARVASAWQGAKQLSLNGLGDASPMTPKAFCDPP